MDSLSDYSNERPDLARKLASLILFLNEGGQLKSTRELAEIMGVSSGSVSYAMNALEQIGAAEFNRRGRLGTFLEKKSLAYLWKIIANAPMVVALTLPSFSKAEGLATGIYSLLDHAGFETYLTYIRGSYNRIKALREGRCNAAIMSVLAAEELCNQGEEIILKLPPQSFVTDHRVFFRTHPIIKNQPLKVGIDPDSFDIKFITELEFSQQNVELIPIPFVQIDLHLEKSSVDTAISNADHLQRLTGRGISSRPLSTPVLERLTERDTSAALVIRANEPETSFVLKEILDPGKLLDIQNKVENGLIVPRY